MKSSTKKISWDRTSAIKAVFAKLSKHSKDKRCGELIVFATGSLADVLSVSDYTNMNLNDASDQQIKKLAVMFKTVKNIKDNK